MAGCWRCLTRACFYPLQGIAAGHVYYYLEDVYPAISGRRLLKTPAILKAVFPPEDVVNYAEGRRDENGNEVF